MMPLLDEDRPSRRPDIADILGVIGMGALSYGAWLIYPPAAFIVIGLCLVIIAGITAVTKARR